MLRTIWHTVAIQIFAKEINEVKERVFETIIQKMQIQTHLCLIWENC